jgi:hypothetical protein
VPRRMLDRRSGTREAGSVDRRSARRCRGLVRLERDGHRRGLVPVGAGGSRRSDRLTRRFDAQEMVPSASTSSGAAAIARGEESHAEAFECFFRRPSVARLGAVALVRDRRNERVVAGDGCLEWPWAVSGGLQSAATPTHRPGVAGASHCALEATSSKHAPRDHEPTWRGGD